MWHCNKVYSLPGGILREPGKGESHALAIGRVCSSLPLLLKCLYIACDFSFHDGAFEHSNPLYA